MKPQRPSPEIKNNSCRMHPNKHTFTAYSKNTYRHAYKTEIAGKTALY
jgi:hypothetical protein